MKRKIFVCGTRKKGYEKIVFEALDSAKEMFGLDMLIIEGCCQDSADSYAEEWCRKNNIPLKHFPGTPGNYLNRNIEMAEECDECLAFWDGYSYGTAHSISQCTKLGKEVIIFDITNRNGN
jgi:hypothetical protein